MNREVIDLYALDYHAFLDVVFSRMHPHDEVEGDLDLDIEEDGIVLAHLERLFNNFPEAARKYTLEQIDNGIWGLFSSYKYFDMELVEYIVEAPAPGEKPDLQDRLRCIKAMYNVYADFVSKCEVEVIENCFEMWWHLVCVGFWCRAARKRADREQRSAFERLNSEISYDELVPDEREIIDTIFDTLVRILSLDDLRTQNFALHGLGHAQHPKVRDVVQNYIDTKATDWDREGIAWLEECRDGTVM